MKLFNHIRQFIRQMPDRLANQLKQRQEQVELDKLEVERLDRICNPSKYRGK